MRPVFTNPELQKRFDQDGFVHIPGFLNPDQVEGLKAKFFELLPERGGSMLNQDVDFKSDSPITYDFTFIDKNWEYKQKVFDEITAVFEPLSGQYLDHYKPIIANFIRKEENGGEVPLHQNWAFVDERKYTSVSIWVPLVDSNVENGTLQIVPGSHKRFGELRGPMIPWELDEIGNEIITDFMVPMIAKAGDTVILDDSVVHYSNVNTIGGLRLTIQLIMIPSETESIHFHLDRNENEKLVQVLEVDRDFYMKFHPWLKPKGKKLGTRNFSLKYTSRQEFEQRLRAPAFDSAEFDHSEQDEVQPLGKGFLQRIKRLFS